MRIRVGILEAAPPAPPAPPTTRPRGPVRMPISARPIAACGLGILLLALAPAPTGDLRGFTAESAKVQRDWEAKFRAIPSPDSLREYMRHLSARPHHVGSPYDKDNADWILAKFKSFGLDARIETFDVLFPTPKERVVELVAPTTFRAKLQEPPVPGDPTSSQQAEQLPTYNAYSIDGDVTAPLVYVNFGVPADYERLERLGVSVKGAIVIARYFGSWRGIKPKVAAEHGAIGCLIYSDPKEDGYTHGDVYPQGPWRPRDGVQRGSVMDMPLYPGDPLTPGVGATKDAKRLAPTDSCSSKAGSRAARSSTRRGTVRSPRCSARPNGSRPTPTSWARRPWHTSTATPTIEGTWTSAARTRSRRLSTTSRGTSTTPRPGSAPGNAPSSAPSPTPARPTSVRRRGNGPTCASLRSDPARTTPRSCSTSGSRP